MYPLTRGSAHVHQETIRLNFIHFLNHTLFILKYIFRTIFFPTKFLSFTDERRAIPVQDTAQRRHRRRRAAGTRCKDSFQIKTLCKPFLLSLVDTRPLVSYYKQGGGWRFGIGHVRILRVPGHQGLITKGVVWPIFIKIEYLRECSVSRVRPYMHQLQIMSLVKCWVCPAPVFCCLTFRSIG